MKKRRFSVAIAFYLFGLIAVGHAGEAITGMVLKMDESSITVDDIETGEEIKLQFDKRTKVKGKLLEDVLVEVEVIDGRATSIHVIEEEPEESDNGAEQEHPKEKAKPEH